MPSDAFVEQFGRVRASAILRTHLAEAAGPAMDAAVRGGFTIIEFTLTTPDALGLIREFSQREGLTVGAGTVLTATDALVAAQAGAQFLVSPVVDDAVIAAAVELQLPVMPGCATPTEMYKAHRLGAPLQKLFPQQDPVWVRQTLGPMPFLKIVPTSGVHLNNCGAFLKAGAYAVGFVNTLFDANDMANGEFDRIEDRARKMLAEVKKSF